MSASCSKVVIDHVCNLSFSWKSVEFLSGLLFDTDSSSEILVGDDPLFLADVIFDNSSIVGHPELELTTVLKLTFQHWSLQCL